MITYEWSFPAYDYKKNFDEFTDFVYNIHWIYTANKDGIISSTYGVLSVENENKKNFISLEDLTENNFINWCESLLNINELNIILENQIILKENPNEVMVKEPFKNKK